MNNNISPEQQIIKACRFICGMLVFFAFALCVVISLFSGNNFSAAFLHGIGATIFIVFLIKNLYNC